MKLVKVENGRYQLVCDRWTVEGDWEFISSTLVNEGTSEAAIEAYRRELQAGLTEIVPTPLDREFTGMLLNVLAIVETRDELAFCVARHGIGTKSREVFDRLQGLYHSLDFDAVLSALGVDDKEIAKANAA